VSVDFMVYGIGEGMPQRLVRVVPYPALQELFDLLGASVTDAEREHLMTVRGYRGTPTLEWYAKQLKKFRASSPDERVSLADASEQPDGIALKDKPRRR
jgi:hypothetical protein